MFEGGLVTAAVGLGLAAMGSVWIVTRRLPSQRGQTDWYAESAVRSTRYFIPVGIAAVLVGRVLVLGTSR